MTRPAARLPRAAAMIVAPQPDAVEAGADVLREGGSAVDAVLACALVQGVVDPLMCGVGGLGVLQVFDARSGRHEVIEGLSTVPGAATEGMWADRFRGVCADGYGYMVDGAVNEKGAGAVTTPGILRVFEAAHEGYGALPWARLFRPAVARARDGWAVRPHVHAMMTMDESAYGRESFASKLEHTAEGRALYMRGDAPKPVGAEVRNPALGATLEAVAEGGAAAFYEGALAGKMAEACARDGGLMRREDLAGFRVRRGEALAVEYRGRRVCVPPPPAGGVVVAEMLRILERFDLVGMGHNSAEYIRVLAEAMKLAGRDKDRHIGDPDFLPPPLERLLSDEYAEACARGIRAGEKVSMTAADPEGRDTTTVSCRDGRGMVATLTHTLGTPSGVIPEGTGFMLNGAMNWYDPRPGRAGSIAPGKRRFSSMSPTIVLEGGVLEGGVPVLTIGAPGGAWIGVAILQGLLNALDWGMTMQEAVMAPRVSATTDVIDISNRVPRRVEAGLVEMGYRVRRSPASYPFAALHGISMWDGVLEGGADPQRDGYAAGVVEGSVG